ncbi:hypothetical protein B5C01_10805 [Staphylococcus delphini]|uniref:Bacteriophage protein n=1 Tax=Staphylococcus delphini TaxID=53344 RepID=A0A2A4GV41_9STAP|nr:hypothetical protein [Staphylococcus delphini]PCF54111.1 hypothetical protein B5C08_11670 [Staphylococcus delphini]PCF60042.1 hypothetical protein B5C01_10805 [Staphylococcus delphini]UXS21176.1 hypothetical protein MUA22_10135 [Staphylococcus delphini]
MKLDYKQADVNEELEKRIGKRRLLKITDQALVEAGEVVYETVKANLRYFRDSGAEYGEIKLSKPMWEKGNRSIRIYWEGEKQRYSIVHLNEKGFYGRDGKFIRPKGLGAIDKALRASRDRFFKVFSEEVSKLI